MHVLHSLFRSKYWKCQVDSHLWGLSLSDATFSSTNILSGLDLGKFIVVKQIHKLVVQAHSKVYWNQI